MCCSIVYGCCLVKAQGLRPGEVHSHFLPHNLYSFAGELSSDHQASENLFSGPFRIPAQTFPFSSPRYISLCLQNQAPKKCQVSQGSRSLILTKVSKRTLEKLESESCQTKQIVYPHQNPKVGTPAHLEFDLSLQNWPFPLHFNSWVRAHRKGAQNGPKNALFSNLSHSLQKRSSRHKTNVYFGGMLVSKSGLRFLRSGTM